MRLRIYDPIVLALDLRHRRSGYAVYEGHRQLLDWGVCTHAAQAEAQGEMASKRFVELLKSYSPSAIVVKQEQWDRAATDSNLCALVNAVTHEAAMRSIPIHIIEEGHVKTTFRILGADTKEELVAVLARIFPELVWNLPPKRRTWDSEHSSLRIFDAIALGLAFWQHPSAAFQGPP